MIMGAGVEMGANRTSACNPYIFLGKKSMLKKGR
jgi:hypothetical protein